MSSVVTEVGSSRRSDIYISFQRDIAVLPESIMSIISKKRAGEGSITLVATRSRCMLRSYAFVFLLLNFCVDLTGRRLYTFYRTVVLGSRAIFEGIDQGMAREPGNVKEVPRDGSRGC
jgi:hypothetical protein